MDKFIIEPKMVMSEQRFRQPIPQWHGVESWVILNTGVVGVPIARFTVEFNGLLITPSKVIRVVSKASDRMLNSVINDYVNANNH